MAQGYQDSDLQNLQEYGNFDKKFVDIPQDMDPQMMYQQDGQVANEIYYDQDTGEMIHPSELLGGNIQYIQQNQAPRKLYCPHLTLRTPVRPIQ